MQKINTAELCRLQVINQCDGALLGYPSSFEIDLCEGKILSIIVEEDCLSLFGKKEEYCIPWCRIECIGEDAILVKIPKEELICTSGGFGKGNRHRKCK